MQTFFDDSTFSYTVTIQGLINLCQSNEGTALTATASQAVQCGLISDASKLGDLLNELKGKAIGGRTITPHIFIPYYDTSLFITPTWDGATVYRIILNDLYAKQNVGVPVKIWNGTVWADSAYRDAQMMIERLHWVVEFGELEDTPIPPIKRCRCYAGEGGGLICHPSFSGPTGWGNCGMSFFGGNCTGDCVERIGSVVIN